MVFQILKATCSSRIVAADSSADKLETARKLGPDVVVNSGSKSAEEEIRDLVGGRASLWRLIWVRRSRRSIWRAR
ncbi:zinc-binding dehydrogenase [Novosphingobium sp. BW1]|uniref:zinc-binding dehydrogenase n=1 Tax=Novosphingobium sp. BW1 TaxID=2592621 RepID=UPI001968410F